MYKRLLNLTIINNTACVSIVCCVTPHARYSDWSLPSQDPLHWPWRNVTTWIVAMRDKSKEWKRSVRKKGSGNAHLWANAQLFAQKMSIQQAPFSVTKWLPRPTGGNRF